MTSVRFCVRPIVSEASKLRVMQREAWLCLVGLTILAVEIAVRVARWASHCDHRVAGWTMQTDDGCAESVPVHILGPVWECLQHFHDGRGCQLKPIKQQSYRNDFRAPALVFVAWCAPPAWLDTHRSLGTMWNCCP